MKKEKELLGLYVTQLEKIIIEFNINEDNALKLLGELKEALSKKEPVSYEGRELYEACVYNALATINTVPQQERKSGQLICALVEAKEEIKAIIEFI